MPGIPGTHDNHNHSHHQPEILDQTIDNTLYKHYAYIISELVDEWGEAGGDVKIGACIFNASVRTSFFHRPLIEK